jgi:MSHA type pilus biogenesis protein MshL
MEEHRKMRRESIPTKLVTSNRLQLSMSTIFLLICAVILNGCAIHQPQKPKSKDTVVLEQKQPKEFLARPKVRQRPGLPPFREQLVPVTQKKMRSPILYSLSFEEAPLGAVITALTKNSDYNLSVESEVDLARPVTVSLKNVTFEEALDTVVINGAGYAWTIEDGTLAIKRFSERIYQLDCLDLISETSIDVGGDMLASSTENAGVSGKYQIKAKNPQEGSDLWLAVENALKGLKSSEGLLRINRNAGVIFMADSPRKVAAMVRFLDSLSDSLNRQVFVEARIMEVHLSEENKYGIDWGNLDVGFSDSGTTIPDVFALTFNDGLIAKTDQSRFQAVLDFLKTQGDVRVLSNPHISVMNRQTAVLTIGFQYPFADVEGVDRDALTGFITIGASIKRAVLGLQLGLTAQISKDGMVTFHIVPTLTRIDREIDLQIPVGGQAAQTISNPVIDLRELATTVRVRDGNSFVMAGLIRKIKTINHESLPLLGDLPFIGPLFRHMKDSEENTELVILMTPYIRYDA